MSLNCKFIETSAKSRVNVDKAFHELIREIRRYDRKIPGCPTSSSISILGVDYPTKGIAVADRKQATCSSSCSVM